jgi:hypothetical protein
MNNQALWEFDPVDCSDINESVESLPFSDKEKFEIRTYLIYDLTYVLSQGCTAYRKHLATVKDSTYMSLSRYDTLDYSSFFKDNPNHFLINLRAGEKLMAEGDYGKALDTIMQISDDLPGSFSRNRKSRIC